MESIRHRFRRDIADADVAFGIQLYRSRRQLEWCAPLLREHYPTARVMLITDGDGETYDDIATRFGFTLVRGDHLMALETCDRYVNRLLTHLLQGPETFLFRIDPDTRIWRRFLELPDFTALFGTLETVTEAERREIRVPANLQGGCIGMTRDAAAEILDSGVINRQSCVVDFASTWARAPELLRNAKDGVMSDDFILSWAAHARQLPLIESAEIRSRWRRTPDNPDLRFAVTHPHKVPVHYKSQTWEAPLERAKLSKLAASLHAELHSPSIVAAFGINIFTAAMVTTAYAEHRHTPDPFGVPIFWHLFSRYELRGGLLLLGIGLLAQILACCIGTAWVDRALTWVGGHVLGLAAGAALGAIAIALVVHQAYPLCIDEYAPYLQSQIFAGGKLFATWPSSWIERGFPFNTRQIFVDASLDSGRFVEKYWPGFALMLTPFTWAGVPWLANPLLTALGLYAASRLAGLRAGRPAAAGWTALLMIASAAFLIDGGSLYSMTAHLALNAVFAMLLAASPKPKLATAGIVGSVALSLHNPLPHLVFALPWIASVAMGRDRWRSLARLAMGYAPGTLVLVGGWVYLRRAAIGQMPGSTAEGYASLDPVQMVSRVFEWPHRDTLYLRAIDVIHLFFWAAPGLPFLAVAGAWLYRRDRVARCLTLSAALTFGIYWFIPYTQGHGWGARYFHSAWFVLPVLAGMALAHPALVPYRRVALLATALSAVLAVPQRAAQVRAFVADHLALLPTTADVPADQWPVVFLVLGKQYYDVDLVQSQAFLAKAPWVFESYGPPLDEKFLTTDFPDAKLRRTTEAWSVWSIPKASVDAWRLAHFP